MYNKMTLQVLAATSGLGEQRILELWEGADLYARAQAGQPGTPQYSRVFQERMVMLVEREVAKRQEDAEAPLVMVDAHLGQISYSLADALASFGSRTRGTLH